MTVQIYLILFSGWVGFHYMTIPQFLDMTPVGEALGCLQIIIINNAAVSIFVLISLHPCTFKYLELEYER